MINFNLKLKHYREISLIIILIVFVLLHMVYKNVILTSDDYRYIFSRYDSSMVNSIYSAWLSFKAEYLNWSGRFAHFIDIFLLISKGQIWRITTPALIAILPFELFYFAKLKLPQSYKDFVIILLIYFLYSLFPNLYTFQMFYWHTACITYFYMPFFMLLVLMPFRKNFSLNKKQKKIYCFIIPIFLFFISMSQEVVGAICVAFIFFSIIYKKIKGNKIVLFDVVSFGTSLVGFLILFLSPGNRIRQSMPTFYWWNEASFLSKIKNGLGYFIFNQYIVQYVIILVLVVLIVIYLFKSNNKLKKISIVYHLFFILMLSILYFADSYFPWSFLTKWKYSLEYINYSIIDILLPLIVYGLETINIIYGLVLYSIEKKNALWFVLISAVFCSNLIVIFTPVGTSYISFPGIMITMIIICEFVSNTQLGNTTLLILSIMFVLTFSINELKEIKKMRIVKQEEKLRISEIEKQLTNKEINLKKYTYAVWEGDYISEEYKNYYNIPSSTNVVVN